MYFALDLHAPLSLNSGTIAPVTCVLIAFDSETEISTEGRLGNESANQRRTCLRQTRQAKTI